jgi:multidrug efflux pump subunit AcrB
LRFQDREIPRLVAYDDDRTEILVDVTLPQGATIEATGASVTKLESWLRKQPETQLVTSYIGGGAPRFFLAYNPELPNPNFAKLIVTTPDAQAQSRLLLRLRRSLADGLAQEARVRASRFVFGPYSPWPVAFRVSGPDLVKVRSISDEVLAKMQADPNTRQANEDWSERAPTLHFVLDQDRLNLLGLSPSETARELKFLLTGVPLTQVREDIRTVEVVARISGENRVDPTKLMNMTLSTAGHRSIPLSQIGKIEIRQEDPILKRRDRLPTITVQCDIDDSLQAPEVTMEIAKSFQPIIGKLPEGYTIQIGAAVEEAAKANVALAAVIPIMVVCMLVVIILQCGPFLHWP